MPTGSSASVAVQRAEAQARGGSAGATGTTRTAAADCKASSARLLEATRWRSRRRCAREAIVRRAAATPRSSSPSTRAERRAPTARPTSTTCSCGRATCSPTSPEARAYFRAPLPRAPHRRVPGHRPGAGRDRAAARERRSAGRRLARRSRREPGGLTVVGDPKQSIYRFRRADIAVYDAVKQRAARAAGEAQLVQNFRSVAGVIAWVERVFDRVLVEEAGVQPRQRRARAGRRGARAMSRRSVCVVHGQRRGRGPTRVRRGGTRPRRRAATRSSTTAGPVRDRGRRSERAGALGRHRDPLPRAPALELPRGASAGPAIPYRAEGGRAFFQRQEVATSRTLLRAIDDPPDRRRARRRAALERVRLQRRGRRPSTSLRGQPARPTACRRTTGGPASVREALAVLRDLHRLRARASRWRSSCAQCSTRTRLVELALHGCGRQAIRRQPGQARRPGARLHRRGRRRPARRSRTGSTEQRRPRRTTPRRPSPRRPTTSCGS